MQYSIGYGSFGNIFTKYPAVYGQEVKISSLKCKYISYDERQKIEKIIERRQVWILDG